MERRAFLTAMTGAMAAGRFGRAAAGQRGGGDAAAAPRTAAAQSQQRTLGPEVFARRLQRLRAELETHELHLLATEPGTNFQYFAGSNPGRSERLILLLVPVAGDPVIVCPSFEVERVRRSSQIADVRGWEEQEDPWELVQAAGRAMRPRRGGGRCAVESSTRFGVFRQLARALSGWDLREAAEVLDPIRMIKSTEELALIHRAITITEASIAATFAQLAPDMTERDVSRRLAQEMQTRGGSGGGLVQFGPSSALPHGGPAGAALARETVVLIDAGTSVEGYTSDITRTIWWGDAPSEEFVRIFNTVHDAQTAAMELGKPFTVRCQDLDRAARGLIGQAGYGEFFTHRLGHGMGMDGHEPPYLVEGNETRLEIGMVFTIEPGIYQLGKFGVRIEDDVLVTDSGIEVLSNRPAKL